jgi:hypothetical protein
MLAPVCPCPAHAQKQGPRLCLFSHKLKVQDINARDNSEPGRGRVGLSQIRGIACLNPWTRRVVGIYQPPASTIPRSGSIAEVNHSRLFVGLALDWFKCNS